MKKNQAINELKNHGIDYDSLKKDFNIRLRKGEPIMRQILGQIIKKIIKEKAELLQIISPKNLIENHESKMIKKNLKEKIYESLKELSLISWKIKKAMINGEKEKFEAIKSAQDYFAKEYLAIKNELCDELINNWKKEEIRDNYYIS